MACEVVLGVEVWCVEEREVRDLVLHRIFLYHTTHSPGT